MIHHTRKDSLRFASIDIGSNAMRLLFCRVIESDGSPTFVKESLIRMPLRLGKDAFTIGAISVKNSKKLIDTIHAFYLMIRAYEPVSFRSCATAALRTASNGKKLVDTINSKVDVGLEIISGEEEARIIMANHIDQHLNQEKNYIYIDVGGGSTAVSFIYKRQKVSSKSFSIGSVRLLEDQVTNNEWDELKRWVLKNKAKSLEEEFKDFSSYAEILDLVDIREYGFPDVLDYEGNDTVVISWWVMDFKNKKSGETSTIFQHIVHHFNEDGEIVRENYYFNPAQLPL